MNLKNILKKQKHQTTTMFFVSFNKSKLHQFKFSSFIFSETEHESQWEIFMSNIHLPNKQLLINFTHSNNVLINISFLYHLIWNVARYSHVPNCRGYKYCRGKINAIKRGHNKRGGLVWWEITLKGWNEQ